MKKILTVAALMLGGLATFAQTNITQTVITTNIVEMIPASTFDGLGGALTLLYNETAGSTNLAVVPFGGRKLSGNAWCAGTLIAYNLNQNVAMVAGLDHLWCSGAEPSSFTVSGGLQIQTVIHPLANFGLTNFVVHPFAMSLVGTPMNGNNNGNVMNLNRVGAYFDVPLGKSANFDIGGAFGNRTGCGSAYDGNWANVFVAISFGHRVY